jgi:hypothetical protein
MNSETCEVVICDLISNPNWRNIAFKILDNISGGIAVFLPQNLIVQWQPWPDFIHGPGILDRILTYRSSPQSR